MLEYQTSGFVRLLFFVAPKISAENQLGFFLILIEEWPEVKTFVSV